MTTETARQHLADVWGTCRLARGWLVRSHGLSPRPPFADLEPAECDQLEALAARFARVVDLFLQKFMRALDRYELEATGSLLDTANHAVKRGLVDDVEILRDLKDLRNEVAHEYVIEDLDRLYEEIYEATPVLLKILERSESYLEETHHLRVDGKEG